MTDTTLITQAVIAGFESQLAELKEQVAEINSDLIETTQNLVNALNAAITALTAMLNSHVIKNYSAAHGGISAYTGKYRDSGNDLVGDQIIQLVVGGSTYYIPATQNISGLCHTQCDCDCHCRGAW